MIERPVLMLEQFGQAFYMLLEAKHEFYYLVAFREFDAKYNHIQISIGFFIS